MPFGDITELRDAVRTRTERDTASLPDALLDDFIAQSEEIHRYSPNTKDMPGIRLMAQRSTETVTPAGSSIILAADWLETHRLSYDQGGRFVVMKMTDLQSLHKRTTPARSVPKLFALNNDGGTLQFLTDVNPQDKQFVHTFSKRNPALIVTATNALLTDYPNAYFFLVLYYAYDHLLDTAKAAKSLAQYQAHASYINMTENRKRWGGGPISAGPMVA